MKITKVEVDLVNATVTSTFEDGTSEVINAPIAPAVQGVSLEDLQKVEAEAQTVVADVQGLEAKAGTTSPEVIPADTTSADVTA